MLNKVLTGLVFVAMSGYVNAESDIANVGKIDVVNCQSVAVDGKQECVIRLSRDTQEASVLRGKIVYQNYCIVCHGKDYDGKGRVAKIHNPKPSNLIASMLPKENVMSIVRKGGEAVGRYKGMPPWEEQLTDEQLADVFNFVMTVREPS